MKRASRSRDAIAIDRTAAITLVVGIVLLLGVTFFSWKATTEATYERNLAAFNTLAKDSEQALIHRIDSYRQSLDSGAALFAASDQVSLNDWKTFVDILKIEEALPGINGIGYIEPVMRARQSEYLADLSARGVQGLTVHPQSDRSELLSISYIEPVSVNKEAVGLDIGFEANRRAAAYHARDTGDATITKRIFLVQDKTKSAGFLLLRPIYAPDMPVGSVAQRRAAFRGWIYAPFVAARFMKELTASQGTYFAIAVHDGDTVAASQLIFESDSGMSGARASLYKVSKTLPIMGQRWTVSWKSTRAFESSVGNQEPMFVLIGGVALILAFATLVIFFARREAYVKEEVRSKTQTLVDKEKEIVQALKVAEAATGAKSKFLANMSHEIRTPMNSVIGFTELLDDGTLNETQQKYVRLISDSGSSMMTLLNDILDISKVDSGAMAITPEPADVRHLLNSCVKLFSPSAEEKHLNLVVDLAVDLPQWVNVDGFRLRQVVMNLLANAIKFTDAGTITMSANFGQSSSSGTPRQSSGDMHIIVADTGVGISPARQGAIFEPFVQEDDSTARKYGGSGLGLTISKQLVELMGGSIAMDSRVGRGSKFSITIPVDRIAEAGCDDQTCGTPEAAASGKSDGAAKRILVAEDHDINQVLIGEMLTKLGYTYELAIDGAEAVAMIRKADGAKKQYDLALMDLQMPYVDGIKATRMVRGQGIDAKALPIVALTANAFEQDVARCLEAGMQAHLAKPLAIEDLRSAVLNWTA